MTQLASIQAHRACCASQSPGSAGVARAHVFNLDSVRENAFKTQTQAEGVAYIEYKTEAIPVGNMGEFDRKDYTLKLNVE